jgi:hypothetical protein
MIMVIRKLATRGQSGRSCSQSPESIMQSRTVVRRAQCVCVTSPWKFAQSGFGGNVIYCTGLEEQEGRLTRWWEEKRPKM